MERLAFVRFEWENRRSNGETPLRRVAGHKRLGLALAHDHFASALGFPVGFLFNDTGTYSAATRLAHSSQFPRTGAPALGGNRFRASGASLSQEAQNQEMSKSIRSGVQAKGPKPKVMR